MYLLSRCDLSVGADRGSDSRIGRDRNNVRRISMAGRRVVQNLYAHFRIARYLPFRFGVSGIISLHRCEHLIVARAVAIVTDGFAAQLTPETIERVD